MKERLNNFIKRSNQFVSENFGVIVIGTFVGTVIFRNYTFYKFLMKKADHTFEYIYKIKGDEL